MMTTFWSIFGAIVLIAGLLDAQKYHDLTRKIKERNSAKGISRTFNNKAVFHKIVLFIWATFNLHDWAISVGTLIALYTSVELWLTTYYYYSYKYKNLRNFKRPSIVKYFWNSLLPNKPSNRL